MQSFDIRRSEGGDRQDSYIRDFVGYTEVDFNLGFGGMPTDMVRRVMRTLAEKVMPHFR